MRKIICLAFLLFLTSTALADSAQGKKLFNRNSCNQCHIVSAPTPAKIAEKYQGKPGSAENLTSQFKAGAFNKNANATARHTAAVSEMSENDMQIVMQWLSGDTSTSTTSTASSTAKPDASGAAVLGAVGAVAGVYLENQEAKSNSRSRNSSSSQPAAQARTQTSQNNYPSDNNYEQSSSNSSSSSSSGRETTLAINHCASVTRDKYETQIFKNVCNIPISLYWCVESECASDNGRLVRLKPGSTYNVMAGEGKQFYFIACPQPYLPNERPNGVFDGKSVTCEK